MDAMLLPRQLVCLAQSTLLRHHWFFHLDLSSRSLRPMVFIANPQLTDILLSRCPVYLPGTMILKERRRQG